MENVKITSYSSDFGTKETEYDTPQRYPHSDVECHGAIPFSQPWVTPCGDSELYTPQVVNLFCDGSLDQLNEAPESSVPTPEAPASRPKKATGVALKNYDIRLPLENDIYFSIDILQELGRIGIRLNQDTRKWNIVGSESPFVHPDNLLISRTTWKSNPILNTLKTIRCRSGTGRGIWVPKVLYSMQGGRIRDLRRSRRWCVLTTTDSLWVINRISSDTARRNYWRHSVPQIKRSKRVASIAPNVATLRSGRSSKIVGWSFWIQTCHRLIGFRAYQ